MTKATVRDYRKQITERVNVQLRAIKGTASEITEIVDMYKGWVNDKGFNTLVAVYDMFFNRFPNHPLANLRIGTTGSRFRDCAALISYGYLIDLLGMTQTTDVMDWVFLEHIGNDIDRMMTSEDELDMVYSYFPYHVDLGLVTKSAFSATANPHFFTWVHMIGTLMKSPRSLNARHISDSRQLDILANAACVAYAYASSFTFNKVYTEDGQELEEQDEVCEGSDDEGKSSKDDIDAILKSRDPVSWCTIIKSLGGSLPKKVKAFIIKSTSGQSEIREGTMEEQVKRMALMFTR